MGTWVQIPSTHVKAESWWCAPVVLMLGTQRQEDPQNFAESVSSKFSQRQFLKTGDEDRLRKHLTPTSGFYITQEHVYPVLK